MSEVLNAHFPTFPQHDTPAVPSLAMTSLTPTERDMPFLPCLNAQPRLTATRRYNPGLPALTRHSATCPYSPASPVRA